MTRGRSAARKQVRQQRHCSLLPVLPLWAAHACAEVLPTRTLGLTSCLHKCTPCPAWVCELTQPRAPLQGRSDSVADGDGCSCSLELELGGAPVRRVRLRLGRRRDGSEQPARDAYTATLVGLLAPGTCLDVRDCAVTRCGLAGRGACAWRLCRRACCTGASSNGVRGCCCCAGAGCGCAGNPAQGHHPGQRQRQHVRGRGGPGQAAGAWRDRRRA